MPIERKRVQTDVSGPSKTKQANRNETDINLMVGRYKKTGQFQNVNPREAKYGDFSESISLEEAFNRVQEANRSFMQLPAKVRAMANNSPVTLLEMLASEETTQALVAAGLPVKTPPPVGENPAPVNVGVPSGGGVS